MSNSPMIRVYVAGAYSAPDILSGLANMRRGLQLSLVVLKAGFAPFSPWLDYQFSLLGEVTLDEYYRYSMAWLEAADAVIVVKEGAEQSRGTQAELRRASEMGIPVFYEMGELREWAEYSRMLKDRLDGDIAKQRQAWSRSFVADKDEPRKTVAADRDIVEAVVEDAVGRELTPREKSQIRGGKEFVTREMLDSPRWPEMERAARASQAAATIADRPRYRTANGEPVTDPAFIASIDKHLAETRARVKGQIPASKPDAKPINLQEVVGRAAHGESVTVGLDGIEERAAEGVRELRRIAAGVAAANVAAKVTADQAAANMAAAAGGSSSRLDEEADEEPTNGTVQLRHELAEKSRVEGEGHGCVREFCEKNFGEGERPPTFRLIGPPLIAFTGYAGAGKDEAAKTLTDAGWVRVAFADALRDAALAADPIVRIMRGECDAFQTVSYYYERLSRVVAVAGWDAAKKIADVRRLLQRLGTEAGRDIHGHDCWTRIAFRKAEQAVSEGAAGVVITDARFPNEVSEVRRRGGYVVRIDRPNVGPVNGHSSDTAVAEIQPDDVIANCGTVDDLRDAVAACMQRLGVCGGVHAAAGRVAAVAGGSGRRVNFRIFP